MYAAELQRGFHLFKVLCGMIVFKDGAKYKNLLFSKHFLPEHSHEEVSAQF